MREIIQMMQFRTTDGKMFNMYEEAVIHQKLLDKVEDIIQLLGGTNNDICPNSTAFSNGDGYYIVNSDDLDTAMRRTKELQNELNLSLYSLQSRVIYDDIYLGIIARVLSCIFIRDGKNIRVGQPYYVKNFRAVTPHIFKKNKDA